MTVSHTLALFAEAVEQSGEGLFVKSVYTKSEKGEKQWSQQ